MWLWVCMPYQLVCHWCWWSICCLVLWVLHCCSVGLWAILMLCSLVFHSCCVALWATVLLCCAWGYGYYCIALCWALGMCAIPIDIHWCWLIISCSCLVPWVLHLCFVGLWATFVLWYLVSHSCCIVLGVMWTTVMHCVGLWVCMPYQLRCH